MNDAVAQLPDELATLLSPDGDLPEGVEIEKGYYCKWNGRYFIHTRAALPLKDISEGIGFGLWIELSKEDFDKFMQAQDDDTLYAGFTAEGTLANNWPGFEDVNNLKVVVKVVKVDQKPYIWDVSVDDTIDPLFRIALLMQKEDLQTRDRVRSLVGAWMNDFGPQG